MKVFIINDTHLVNDALLKMAMKKLPDSRLELCKKYKKAEDQILCTYSYLLLQYALKATYKWDGIPEFIYNQYGKPSFAERNNVYFNMSHCCKGICCVVSSNVVGIDIQNYEDFDVMKHVMCENEQSLIKCSKNPKEVFTRLWAMKESYFKMLGKGLCEEMKEADFSSLTGSVNYYNGTLLCTLIKPQYVISISTKEIESVKPKINIISVQSKDIYN